MTSVHIDPAAVEALFSDWESPVGRYIAGITEELEDTAQIMAPVSVHGSKCAPPGTLRRQIHTVWSHSDDGSVMGLVGISRSTTKGYPLNFVSNFMGKTRNANQWGYYGTRDARNMFLLDALNTTTRGLF
jgi:hypothetical protein